MPRKKAGPKADPTSCVIYARFSSERQRDESIEDQVRVCSDWAAGHGLTVVATYEDRAISGTSDERPEFLRMISDARSGNFGTVLVYKLDRFARDRFDAAIYRKRLGECGVALRSVMESIPDGPEGAILESVIDGFNEYYSRNLSQNVLRGMIYDHQRRIPYLYNLIDQYRHLGKWNRYAYNMMFVGPGWMNRSGRWEVPYEGLYKSYEDAMRYYGKLKKEGLLIDMTMEEFADFYRIGLDYQEPERCLWKDILYGSTKQYFWYLDPHFRTCLDMNQGGAMIDLRPYAAKLPWKVGIGTRSVYDASYPYLIQANYRAGYFTHYAGEGTVKSYKVKHGSEAYDGCLQRTMARCDVLENGDTLLTLDPVTFAFSDLSCDVVSRFLFKKGEGKIEITREITRIEGKGEVEIEEYFTGAFGINEYQSDMSKIVLTCDGESGHQEIHYAYKCRALHEEKASQIAALIPDVDTLLSMGSDEKVAGNVEEGYAFSPCYRLALSKKFTSKGELRTWLSLRKAS